MSTLEGCRSNSSSTSLSLFSPRIESRQGNLCTVLYSAGADRPHPVIIFAHGFPGHEKNMALAADLRRSGYNVLIYYYSGCWGSEGTFSFAHSIEDELAVIDYVTNDTEHNFNKDNIFLLGHSFGCFVSARAMALRDEIRGAVFLMPYDIGRAYRESQLEDDVTNSLERLLSEGVPFMPNTTSAILHDEIAVDPDQYSFFPIMERFVDRPVFWISCYEDTEAPEDIHTIPFMDELRNYPDHLVTWRRYHSDHYYGDIQHQLSAEIIHFLDSVRRENTAGTGNFTEILKGLIEREYQSLNTENAARYFHFSEPYFSSLVKNKTGENFTTLLRRYRIDRAQELLINTSLSINEIALYVGYSDGPYFMRQFKKETGETPTEFRVRNRRQ